MLKFHTKSFFPFITYHQLTSSTTILTSVSVQIWLYAHECILLHIIGLRLVHFLALQRNSLLKGTAATTEPKRATEGESRKKQFKEAPCSTSKTTQVYETEQKEEPGTKGPESRTVVGGER